MKVFLSLLIVISLCGAINIKHQLKLDENAKDKSIYDTNGNQQKQQDSISVRSILEKAGASFSQAEFDQIFIRQDGLNHILLSDVNKIINSLKSEFSDVIQVQSIGQSWQGRDINLIILDAQSKIAATEQQIQLEKQETEKEARENGEEVNVEQNKEENKEAPESTAQADLALVQIHDDEETPKTETAVQVDNSTTQISQEDIFKNIEQNLQTETDENNTNQANQTAAPEEQKVEVPSKPVKNDLQKQQESAAQSSAAAQSEVKVVIPGQKPEQKAQQNETQQVPIQPQNPLQEEQKVVQKEEKKPEQQAEVQKNSTEKVDVGEIETDQKNSSTEDAKNQTQPAQQAEQNVQTNQTAVQNATVEQKPQGNELSQTQEGDMVARAGPAPSKPAILITGAHHARELITVQMALFTLLKLLQSGVLNHSDQEAMQMLKNNRYYFIPVVNVDGLALIEEDHLINPKTTGILDKRKNMGPNGGGDECKGPTEYGVDLNRNYGIDWKLNLAEHETKCSEYYAGPEPFSEKETQAIRSFMDSHQDEVRFVINFHSNGNSFMWPFNGRSPNDIERRAPGVLPIMTQITSQATFPPNLKMGNAYNVISEKVGGDADDYITGTYGIPSVTSEIGFIDQFIEDWVVKSKEIGFDICKLNQEWLDYIYLNLPAFSQKLQQK